MPFIGSFINFYLFKLIHYQVSVHESYQKKKTKKNTLKIFSIAHTTLKNRMPFFLLFETGKRNEEIAM